MTGKNDASAEVSYRRGVTLLFRVPPSIDISFPRATHSLTSATVDRYIDFVY